MEDALEVAVAATDGVEGDEPVRGKPASRRSSLGSNRVSLFRWSLWKRPSTASEEEYVAPTEALIFLEVRPFTFALIWWGMVAIHTICAVLLSVQTRLYLYLRQPAMSYYVNLVEPDIGSKYLAVAAVFGVLAVFHWRTVVMLVYTSIKQRKYAFFPADHYEMAPMIKPKPTERPAKWWKRVSATLAAWRVALWGRRGLLGVESPYFYPYFYLRECIELTSQIWQAYRGSLLVSRTWINHLSVSIIFVNCLLTPAFQIGYKHRPELRRISMLTLDAVLDFGTAIVVPLSIFMPYFLDFNTATLSFPTEKMHDEQWFVNAVLDNQEFLVVSVADLIFKCIPHVSITGCLKKVRLLIQKDTAIRRNGRKTIYATAVAPRMRRDLAQEKMERIKQKAESTQKPSTCVITLDAKPVKQLSRYTHKYANKLVRLAFVTVGITVLGIHLKGILTSYRAKKQGCRQEMRPWFAPVFACSIFELDCQRLNMTGKESEISLTLSHLYSPAIAALILANCPSLEIPSEIKNFKHLMRLDVYNSSVSKWEDDAALTNSDHPVLVGLTFARVSFQNGELPDGVTSYSFPAGLRSVEISMTNLARLPADLHLRWHHSMNRVFIEHSNLSEVPETFRYFDVEKLSLEGNTISKLDPTWLGDYSHSYLTLAVSCNPSISLLPESIHPSTRIRTLHMHNTNMSALPSWIENEADRVHGLSRIYASNTPLCNAIASGTASSGYNALNASGLLSCVDNDLIEHTVNSVCGLFPMDVVDRKREGK